MLELCTFCVFMQSSLRLLLLFAPCASLTFASSPVRRTHSPTRSYDPPTSFHQGFSLYIDGVLKAEIQPGANRTTLDANDTAIDVPGGDPARLTSNISLCARYVAGPCIGIARHDTGSRHCQTQRNKQRRN